MTLNVGQHRLNCHHECQEASSWRYFHPRCAKEIKRGPELRGQGRSWNLHPLPDDVQGCLGLLTHGNVGVPIEWNRILKLLG